METGKPGLASAPVHISSIAAQTEKKRDTQAPLTAVYIHTMPALPAQPYIQPPAATREPAALQLSVPPLYSKETLPFLTLHIVGGLQAQPGLSLAAVAAAAAAAPAAKLKSSGKHVCPHCGRDCMKPSVLEKHLRCHTGERPYPCTTCGVSFKTQSNLYKHKRTQAHARHSYESEQSSLCSLDSTSSSRETCTSSLSLDEHSKEMGSLEMEASPHAAEVACSGTAALQSVEMRGQAGEQDDLTCAGHKTQQNTAGEVSKGEEKPRVESEKPRHLPLQRQEATLFSKQWESSAGRGKSQSHESTDSGFSESSDHYPSPGSIIPDHSLDSLTESTREHPQDTSGTQAPPEPGHTGQELKDAAREQDQRKLEERISKLISENSAVVEDKQLENVRPRKTVLSKQGSIDLPMPYTYKDSFHFDMRNSKAPNVGMQRSKNPGLYSSVPTQHSTSMEHAPLTRSNSLPFSVTLLQPERSSPTSSSPNDYVTFIRRGSSGQINSTGFAIKPVNQQSSTHRPLVRQTAVDCNHATEALLMSSSVEEACSSSLSCDGEAGDTCGEPSNRKFRRKKAQKFAYNKWYMYGGGTFRKLYDSEKAGDGAGVKGRKSSANTEHEVAQGVQKRLPAVYKEAATTTCPTINFTSSSAAVCHPGCPPAKLCAVDFNLKSSQPQSCGSLKTPLWRNPSLSATPSTSTGSVVAQKTDKTGRAEAERLINEDSRGDSASRLCGANVPSERKKQRTDEKMLCSAEANALTHLQLSVAGSVATTLSYVNLQTSTSHAQLKESSFPACIMSANAQGVCRSPGAPAAAAAAAAAATAKTSFLPKYQLKLPNATEPDSDRSTHVADKQTGSDGCASSLPSSHAEQPPSLTSAKHGADTIASSSAQTCDIRRYFPGHPAFPCTVTTLCQTGMSTRNATPSLVAAHRPLAGAAITTSCRHDCRAGLSSSSAQILKPAVGPAPAGQLRPAAPVVDPPVAITASDQTPAAAVPAFPQGRPLLPPHPRASAAPGQPIPEATDCGSGNQVVPCHVVPFGSVQTAGQKVFHVHTADLQICLEIISDEQLALIEPQIEHHVCGSLSQRHDMGKAASEGMEDKAHNSVSVNNEGRNPEQPGLHIEFKQNESSPITGGSKSLQFGKAQPNLRLTGHADPAQATASAPCKPPQGSSQQPHKQGRVNTESCSGGVTRGAMSGGDRNPAQDPAVLPTCRAGGGGGSRHEPAAQALIMTPANQSSARSELLATEDQHKHKSQGGSCPAGTLKVKNGASARESGESGARVLSWPCGASCADQLPWTPVDKSKLAESASSETQGSPRHANTGCGEARPSENLAHPQEMARSREVIGSASANVQVDRVIPARSPAAGLLEGASLVGRSTQKEPQTPRHEGTPGQPDSTDPRPKQCQEAGETDRRGGGAVAGGTENRVMGGTKADVGPGQRGAAKSKRRLSLSPDMMTGGGEDREVQVASAEQQISQTNSGMSEYPQRTFGSPQAPLDSSDFCSPEQQRRAGGTASKQAQVVCEPGQPTKAQVQSAETQRASPRREPSAQATPAFPSQDRDNGGKTAACCRCCCHTSASGGRACPWAPSDGPTLSAVGPGQVSRSDHVGGDDQAAASRPFTLPAQDATSHGRGGQCGGGGGGADDVSRCQSFFLTAHGYQAAELLSGGLRPVPSCQAYPEDTSSSDDEGKLIIEL